MTLATDRETLAMLPSKPTDEQRLIYVERIIDMYRRATPAQVLAGQDWYPAAHRLATEYGDTRRGAGIIAALSANKGWGENIRLARQAFNGVFYGHFADALGKARRIHEGEDPANVLPMGTKTGHFFQCIADPADPDAVVIDRHAHDVVAGMKFGSDDRGLKSPLRYASIADAYRMGGKRLSMTPSVLQAVVWVVVTELARNSRALVGISGWGVEVAT
jgi:hypothetical protein